LSSLEVARGQRSDVVQLPVQVVEVGGGELQECMIFYELGGHAAKILGLVSSG
jgi:hypothetical protein